jgi:hypothetical protein
MNPAVGSLDPPAELAAETEAGRSAQQRKRSGSMGFVQAIL